MAQDYLGLNDPAFDLWFTIMIQYVTDKCGGSAPAWTHIPQAALTGITDTRTAWETAYANFKGPHTTVDTEAKNDAKAAAKKGIRAFVNQYLRFPPVTDEDRTAMGIPNHDLHPSPTHAPTDIPEVEVRMPLPRVLHFLFRRADMKRWGKPRDVHGMELVWVIADAAPKEVEDLIHSAFATRSPLELTFKESERGKRVYFAVRWETGTMKKGKFSEIYSAIVP